MLFRSDPIDGSPPGSPVPGILKARTLEWVAISFSIWKASKCLTTGSGSKEEGEEEERGEKGEGEKESVALIFIFCNWRRKWQPTPVFLPGESQGRGSLVGCRLWGRTESDMTEGT